MQQHRYFGQNLPNSLSPRRAFTSKKIQIKETPAEKAVSQEEGGQG